ncbi:motility associated factor glycosyltransferase family protein [Clostridium sporogenes]|uniref:motility associated factor glycosyltransferase family protein n=1 Tax=Clostridium sporogenes TaxID=1509 RepID=UPI003DA352C9
MDNRKIKVKDTKEGDFTVCVDNKFLHSKYYPQKEAEKFISSNKKIYENKNDIVVYGFGCGYHIKELLLKSNRECNIYVFDVDECLIKIVEKLGLLKEVKQDKRISLFFGKNKFYEYFGKKLKLVEDILLYKPSINAMPERYYQIKDILKSYELAKIGIERFADIAIENKKSNLNSSNIKNIQEFINKFSQKNKPVVIAAGGPSLEKDLKIMSEKRDEIILFAVGTSLDILMKNSIKPDMVTIIDPQEIVYNQIKEYTNLDVPLCFLSTASKSAVEAYKGSKYIFFNNKCEEDIGNIIINTGKSVAVAALDIAIKTGAKEIIFCGQDLAFTDNRFHAGDKEKYIKASNNNYKIVIGVDDKALNTTLGMLEFKRNIERLIKENVNIKFINSSKGARIEGTVEMDLEKIL